MPTGIQTFRWDIQLAIYWIWSTRLQSVLMLKQSIQKEKNTTLFHNVFCVQATTYTVRIVYIYYVGFN